MKAQHLILCNDASLPGASCPPGTQILKLDRISPNNNINLQIEDISRKLVTNLPSILIDLLEVATYVYCADQAVGRGGSTWPNNGIKWNRNFKFIIPVRNPEIWNKKDIKELLCSMLGFLSDDNYEFHFRKNRRPHTIQEYFGFSKEDISGDLDEVVLFSGGLDSLGGAIDEAIISKKRIVLVSHRSFGTISKRQKYLLSEFMDKCPNNRPYHIPVWINKDSSLTKEYTQRVRSFLFCSLATVISRIIGLNHFKIFENGIVSFNLPISAQLIGARATRSTNPKVIHDFEHFFSLLFETDFKIENPFIWKTKTDVVRLIADSGCSDLISNTVSCSHSYMKTTLSNHCGTCSQCIDRRFAILAAGLEEYDPAEMYETDLILGARKSGEQVTMLESYIRKMNEIENMTDVGFFKEFGDIYNALGCLPGRSSENVGKAFDLYKRQAKNVTGVIDSELQKHASDIRKGSLPDSCLLSLICGKPTSVSDCLIHSADYGSVTLYGVNYKLTPFQAAVVKLLHQSAKNKTPELHQAYILVEVGSKSHRLRDLFRISNAWGKLIVPGEKKGTFRLNL